MGPKEFGEYLAELRINAGYKSQAALSRRSGVGTSTIARLERGATINPDHDTLAKLAPCLDISVNKMLQKAGYIADHEEIPEKEEVKIEKRLVELVAELPEEAQKSLEDFIEYLYIKHHVKSKLNRS